LISTHRLYSLVSIIVCFLIFGFNLLKAQNTNNITVHDGLPTNVVRCIHKATNGVLWIGTDAGLCSYDGRQLLIFDQNDGLPNNLVWAITESDKGEIWIGCYGGGIAYYDGSEIVDCSNNIPSKSIRTLYYENDLLHIGTDRHFIIYDGFEYTHSEDEFQTMKVLKKDTNIFVVSRRKGLYRLVYGKDKKINFSLDSCSYHGMVFGAINYFEDLLIFKNKGLKILKSDSLKNCSPNDQVLGSPSITWNAVVANDSSVYLANWGVSLKNGGLYKLKNNEISLVNELYGITSREISCLHYDELNEVLWVGSIHDGIFKVMLNNAIIYPNSDKKFDTKGVLMILNNDKGQYFYIKENGIYSVEQNEDVKLLCSREKFEYLIKTHPKWKKKASKSLLDKRLAEESLKNLTFYNSQIENEMIWLSTDHGLFRFNTTTKKLDHQYVQGSVFYKDEEKLLLYKPYSFLEKYDDVFSGDKPYKFKEDNAPRDVTKIVKYNNSIWYGSYSRGLIKQSGDEFTSYLKNKIINEEYINHLTVWNDSILVISTGNANIYGLQEKNDSLLVKFKLLSVSNIDANQIYFLESFRDQLLVGTNKGLVIYDGNKTRLINDEEGYYMRDVVSVLQDKDGILMSDKNDVIKLNVNNLNFENQNELYVKSFHTIDSVYKENLNLISTLTFPNDRNYFEIKFSYSNLINPTKDVFNYDLEKKNRHEWVREHNSFVDPNKLSVWCTNLKPGEYRFRLNARNKFTKNEAHSVYYHFKIIPPFWKTGWFIISSCLFILIFSFLIVKYLIRRYKEKEKINLRISETKLEALKAQMNPHFTFNLMNSIQNSILDNDLDKAMLHVSNFSKLIRSTLDYSNQKTISLEEEVKYLKNYVDLQNMRFGDKVKFEIDYPNEYVQNILIPPMILQPLIENVFVHAFSDESANPLLQVNIYLLEPIANANTLFIDVKDNGLGRSKKKITNHLSKGLSIVQERLQLLNKTSKSSIELEYINLKDLDPKTSGTKIQLKVPLTLSAN
jgi:ligand-binding sensor domain-containing protein